MLARFLTLAALSALVYIPAAASTPLAAPTGVHPFYLRVDDPVPRSFPQTPSFAWNPYEGASGYDFELGTSPTFNDQTRVWSTSGSPGAILRVPAVAVPLSLPWMTGRPDALYARVRAHVGDEVTRWSKPFGFNTEGEAPDKLPDIPGLVRWTPVDGATGYEVWFENVVVNGLQGKVIRTTTNVADEREYYTGHQDPGWTQTVVWRVRAFRLCRQPNNGVCDSLPDAVPAVTYGPWSNSFVSINPPVSIGAFLGPVETVSDAIVPANTPDPGTVPHQLTPGFVFSGNLASNGASGRLFRVYVTTDRQCVNVVFTGSVVGSPAYAPRRSGPVELPGTEADTKGYPADAAQGATFNYESLPISTNEQPADSTTPGNPPIAPTATATASPAAFTSTGPFVDLWDLGRANARYWWTVVPVNVMPGPKYQDAVSRQDACAAGDVMEFARTSQPTLTSSTSPFASGLSRFGELAAARTMAPSFYRSPLVAWRAAKSATSYEVQWSRTTSPWVTKGFVTTASTSTLLDRLTPGTWYYRVRGIDPYVPGPIKQMAWSTPVKIKIAKPRFFDQTDVTTKRVKK
jgi:hypothetical protein